MNALNNGASGLNLIQGFGESRKQCGCFRCPHLTMRVSSSPSGASLVTSHFLTARAGIRVGISSP